MSCVAINIIIGNPAINIIMGISKLRNKAIIPIFFKLFLENGSVCNHLKALPDMKDPVESIPNISIYMSVIPKNIIKRSEDTKKIVFIE